MNPIGLYVHIPFCDGKCHYCNFFSVRCTDEMMNEYVGNTKRIIASWGERCDRIVDTVYFGGGTPSILGTKRLVELLDAVKSSFSVLDEAEITAEINPTSSAELDFVTLKSIGFNRLSIGLQSADDRELSLLGRRHTTADAEVTVRRAQQAGFDNISLDVMLAIPEQTFSSLDRTLSFCADCGVKHISAYILKIEEGTRFYRDREQLELYSEDEQASFYEYAVRRLKDLGYPQYEISNFAKPGYESRHNLHYWHDDEYIGIGPSAHSFIGGERFYYPDRFADYYLDQTEYEGKGGDREEYIMLALRLTEGLIFSSYEDRFGEKVNEDLLKRAKKLSDNGLVNINSSSLSLTLKGFLVSNAVIAYLLEKT